MGIEANFTKKDVMNRYSNIQDALDCSGAVRHLEERMEQNPQLFFDYKLDSDGTLSRLFFVMVGASDILKQQGKNTVLLFDTKHGTNRYGHKLGCF